MDFAHGVMVTLISTTTVTDDLGDSTETTVTYEWGPCAIAPRYATESTDARTAPVIVGKTVLGPPLPFDPSELRIKANDTLVLPDGEWQVDGLGGEWTNPFTGWAPGVEVPVKRAASV